MYIVVESDDIFLIFVLFQKYHSNIFDKLNQLFMWNVINWVKFYQCLYFTLLYSIEDSIFQKKQDGSLKQYIYFTSSDYNAGNLIMTFMKCSLISKRHLIECVEGDYGQRCKNLAFQKNLSV